MIDPKADTLLDLRGKVCPYPTLETRFAIDAMDPGEVLEGITDYYPARQTIPDLARRMGLHCELYEDDQKVFHLIIH